jgi:hypothetical protein
MIRLPAVFLASVSVIIPEKGRLEQADARTAAGNELPSAISSRPTGRMRLEAR